MLTCFKTIINECEYEIVLKKSRFIAACRPIDNEDEARAFIDSIKKKHYNAGHHAFAYVIGDKDEVVKQSDDGEPKGTAGLPILDFLQKEQLKYVIAVVTRYFGGTLLGTGGLVRAYGGAAKQCLLNAPIITKVLYDKLDIETDYHSSGKVQHEILSMDLKPVLKNTVFTEKVCFEVLVTTENKHRLVQNIMNLTGGKAKINERPPVYGAQVHDEFLTFYTVPELKRR